jgi:nicotinamide N-methyltransferase
LSKRFQGHHLWQAAQVISTYLQTHAQSLITNKTILELGAAAGLPSIISSLYGAKYVLATDYPDADLVENLQLNIRTNCQENNISAAGYLWGADPAPLLAHIPHTGTDGFDLLILADLLFNHSEHHALLRTVKATLSHSPGAQALVFFTPYRPWLFEKDMAFFTLAQDRSQRFDFRVEKILEERMEKVMFEEDPGDETLRRTVFGYRITWADGNE